MNGHKHGKGIIYYKNDNIKYEGDFINGNILNECVIDTANELIENERIYGEIGEPIKWSLRDKIITFKYTNDNISKNQFKKKITKQLRYLTNFKDILINGMEQTLINIGSLFGAFFFVKFSCHSFFF